MPEDEDLSNLLQKHLEAGSHASTACLEYLQSTLLLAALGNMNCLTKIGCQSQHQQQVLRDAVGLQMCHAGSSTA